MFCFEISILWTNRLSPFHVWWWKTRYALQKIGKSTKLERWKKTNSWIFAISLILVSLKCHITWIHSTTTINNFRCLCPVIYWEMYKKCYLECHLRTFILPPNLTQYCSGWANPDDIIIALNHRQMIKDL